METYYYTKGELSTSENPWNANWAILSQILFPKTKRKGVGALHSIEAVLTNGVDYVALVKNLSFQTHSAKAAIVLRTEILIL